MPIMTFKNYLTEASRADFLRQKFEKPISQVLRIDVERNPEEFEAAWNQLVDADPSRNKQYLQWILTLVTKHNILMSDLDKVHDDLTVFERVKGLIPVQQRDVNRYKAYQDLYDVIKEYGDTKSNKEAKRDEIAEFKKQITTVYTGSKGRIYIPHSEEASCYLGRGTRWCTAATKANNYFRSYNSRGDLIIFITDNGEKYQAHAVPDSRGKDLYRTYTTEGLQFETVLRSVEFKDDLDRQIPDNHKFMQDPLLLEAAKSPFFKNTALILALTMKHERLFKAVAPQHRKLLSEIKSDAEEVISWIQTSNLKSTNLYANIIGMYKFVKDHY